jgi:hemolysin III
MMFIGDIYRFNVVFFWLILTGGLCYTLGVVFYAIPKVFYFHFVWHIFTMLGTIFHAVAILIFIYV